MKKIARLVWLLVMLIMSIVLVAQQPAFAAGDPVKAHVGLSSWPTILAGLCGVGSAQLTALLTHRHAPQWIKSGVHLSLSVLAGVFINLTVVAGNKWTDYVAEIAVAWIAGIGTKIAGGTALAEEVTAEQGVGKNVGPIVPRTPPA